MLFLYFSTLGKFLLYDKILVNHYNGRHSNVVSSSQRELVVITTSSLCFSDKTESKLLSSSLLSYY
ncbi:hypothetical protein BK719_16305 [Bacillus thuringiensis serovar novosibirsk]|nr:hypothetical protein BK719_16305 [Bacillus thuringiensis serovar novosibirsk]